MDDELHAALDYGLDSRVRCECADFSMFFYSVCVHSLLQSCMIWRIILDDKYVYALFVS